MFGKDSKENKILKKKLKDAELKLSKLSKQVYDVHPSDTDIKDAANMFLATENKDFNIKKKKPIENWIAGAFYIRAYYEAQLK